MGEMINGINLGWMTKPDETDEFISDIYEAGKNMAVDFMALLRTLGFFLALCILFAIIFEIAFSISKFEILQAKQRGIRMVLGILIITNATAILALFALWAAGIKF